MPDESLRAAYLATLYRFGPLPETGLVELRVDQRSDALHAWMQQGAHHCAAVVTAFNPGSQRCSSAFNAAAQQRLRDMMLSRALPFIDGQNMDPVGAWPPEDSLLIAGLSLADSRDLAERFGQLAFLWSDTTAVPQLHFTAQQDAMPR